MALRSSWVFQGDGAGPEFPYLGSSAGVLRAQAPNSMETVREGQVLPA